VHHVSTEQPLVFLARGTLTNLEPARAGTRPTLVVGAQVRISHADDTCLTFVHVVDEDSGQAWPVLRLTLAPGAELSVPHP
jgi:hypothetical protein